MRPGTAARRLGLALAAASAAASASPAADRAIRVPREGRVAVVLDADVYEQARPDLGDLRVIDDQGREVAYLLDWMAPTPPPEPRRPLLRPQPRRGGPLHVQLDFERPVLKRELTVSLPGGDFRRRVAVEGRGEHDRRWRPVAVGFVAALPGPPPERYERVSLPDNNDRYLRLTIEDDDGEATLQDASAPAKTLRRCKGVALAAGVARTEQPESRESHLVLSLGARNQPFIAVALEVETASFFRGATEERLVLEAPGRAGTLRVRIRNGAEPPLVVRRATATVPVERLVFEAAGGCSYRLRYGDPALVAPRYELARTIGDAGIWASGAADAVLEEAPPAGSTAAFARWPRHRALAAVVIGLLFAILLVLGWQARRAT